MKPSTGSCCPHLPERFVFVLLASAWLASGCVLPGTHAAVVDERNALEGERAQLADRVALLEASNESLSSERVALLERVEDLRLTSEELETRRTALESQVAELAARREELESSLAAREQQMEEEQQEVGRLRSTYDELVGELQSEVAEGRIEIERLREGLRVQLAQEILFPKGSALISAEGQDVLARVASRLAGEDHLVEVQGHTDDLGIRGRLAERYPTNWELAGARAAAVVRLLEGEGVAPDRLAAISFGPHQPIAPNDSEEGRARNRRIEIRLVPRDPAPAADPAAGE